MTNPDRKLRNIETWVLKFIKENQRNRRFTVKLVKKLKAIWAYLDGKKTYIVAVVVAVIALLNACGVVLPEWTWQLLTAAGLGSLRSGVKKV